MKKYRVEFYFQAGGLYEMYHKIAETDDIRLELNRILSAEYIEIPDPFLELCFIKRGAITEIKVHELQKIPF